MVADFQADIDAIASTGSNGFERTDARRERKGYLSGALQGAVAMVLSAIYEVDFRGFSYGFRPGRGQHDALDALVVGISSRKVNWILDADIRSFFDTVDQKWMIRFVEHRVGDPRIIRLIQKWMKAGVLVVGFEHETDARRFLDMMRTRLEEFALSLHPEKTRLIEFGRHAAADREQRGLGKPETFNFLGFFICRGRFQIIRKTRQPYDGEAFGIEGGNATTHALANLRTGRVAEAGRGRFLQPPRRADQQPGTCGLPIPRHDSMGTHASAAEPEGPLDVGPDRPSG
jgi:hypothetical protein